MEKSLFSSLVEESFNNPLRNYKSTLLNTSETTSYKSVEEVTNDLTTLLDTHYVKNVNMFGELGSNVKIKNVGLGQYFEDGYGNIHYLKDVVSVNKVAKSRLSVADLQMGWVAMQIEIDTTKNKYIKNEFVDIAIKKK